MSADIVQAIQSPSLLGPLFPDLRSWSSWMAVLKWLYGIPCDETELELFQLITGRTAPRPGGYQNAVMVVGRRGGKSRISATIALYEAVFQHWKRHAAPGEEIWVHVLAVDKQQASVVLGHIRAGLELFPGLIKSQDSESIHLTTGIAIGVKAASLRGVRGYTSCCLICDEAHWWRDETAANPLDEILTALHPGLVEGGRTLLISSPYSKQGSFYQLFKSGFGNDEDDETLVIQAPSDLMNPTLNVGGLIKRMLRKTRFAGNEYSGQFRDDIQNLFSEASVDRAMTREPCPPDPKLPYVAFIDAAGGSGNDSFTMAIALQTPEGAINICRVEEREPPFDPTVVTAEYAAILAKYGLSRCTGDRYGGQFPVSMFAQHVVRLDICSENKSELYKQFAALLNSGRVHLPRDDERLKAQLLSLEQYGREGKVDAPRGYHEDRANAVAGAVVLAAENRRLTEAEIESRLPRMSGHMSPRGTLIAQEQEKADQRRDNELILDEWMRGQGCTKADALPKRRRPW
jgi:hypothetical protein